MNIYEKLSGKRAKIIAETYGHEFDIGTEVTLLYNSSCNEDILGIDDKGIDWFLNVEEFELIDDGLESLAYNVAINWNHSELGGPSALPRTLTTGLAEALDKLVDHFKNQN